jgi:hypothetical protein
LSLDQTRGLSELNQILRKNAIDYWIDSGVLLGLARSGKLNAWEKDIDLGIEGCHLEKLLALEPEFQKVGWRYAINRYRGVIYSIGLKPDATRPSSDLEASFHVYYEAGEHLWSPQTQFYVPAPAPDIYLGKRSFAGKALESLIEFLFFQKNKNKKKDSETPQSEPSKKNSKSLNRTSFIFKFAHWIYQKIDRGFLAETWPLKEVYVPLTWVVPQKFILPLKTEVIDGQEYPFPAQAHEYLSYRYGDWKTPVKEWFYWEHDGAIRRENPMQVRDKLKKETA